jgi:hypothetical protein
VRTIAGIFSNGRWMTVSVSPIGVALATVPARRSRRKPAQKVKKTARGRSFITLSLLIGAFAAEI